MWPHLEFSLSLSLSRISLGALDCDCTRVPSPRRGTGPLSPRAGPFPVQVADPLVKGVFWVPAVSWECLVASTYP